MATIEGEGGKAVCEVVPVGDKLALWSHPQELKAAYHEHGWTAQSIASIWDSSIGLNQETVGLPSA